MSFETITFTNKGRALQAKAAAGAQLNYNRIAVGDGQLSGQAIEELNALVHEVKSLSINAIKVLSGNKAKVGGVLSNQGLLTGFYWRELGVFAQDPDLGEILYCYGNAGALAEYIPSPGGSEILEKQVNVITIVGNATNVTATIDSSAVYITSQDADARYAKNSDLGSAAYTDSTVYATAAQGTKADNAATQAALNSHLSESASETVKGHVELATAAETTTGTDSTRAVHPAGLKVELNKKANLTDLASTAASKGASLIGVQDSAAHFTGTNIETVLAELFTFANDGKTNIAGVIGSPALSSDTFTQLKDKIQTQKNTLATNLVNKGQSSAGTETLAALIGKVANIALGKKWATGTTDWPQTGGISISGIGFTPSSFLILTSTTTTKGYLGASRMSGLHSAGVCTIHSGSSGGLAGSYTFSENTLTISNSIGGGVYPVMWLMIE